MPALVHNALFPLAMLCAQLLQRSQYGCFACDRRRLCLQCIFCFRPSSGLSNVLNAHGGRKKLQTANCGASHHHEPAPFVTWHDARLVTFCNFDPGQTCR
jgi:hypothetical protein